METEFTDLEKGTEIELKETTTESPRDTHKTNEENEILNEKEILNDISQEQPPVEVYNIFLIAWNTISNKFKRWFSASKMMSKWRERKYLITEVQLRNKLPRRILKLYDWLRSDRGSKYFRWTINVCMLLICIGVIAILCVEKWERLQNLFGFVSFLLFAFAVSVNQKRVNWNCIVWGFFLQFLFAILVLYTHVGYTVISFIGEVLFFNNAN